ncbi:MAG TPA: hypothetical protein VEV17_15480 [Bryobacteraceae bacterium]|nr:hypothetical protein [Bryobacteraceae bacterium]
MKCVGMVLLLVGVAGFALGNVGVPEIDGGSAGSALALLSGAVLLMRSRRKN